MILAKIVRCFYNADVMCYSDMRPGIVRERTKTLGYCYDRYDFKEG